MGAGVGAVLGAGVGAVLGACVGAARPGDGETAVWPLLQAAPAIASARRPTLHPIELDYREFDGAACSTVLATVGLERRVARFDRSAPVLVASVGAESPPSGGSEGGSAVWPSVDM